MITKERAAEINEILQKASKAYYDKDAPIMTDREYDALYDELTEFENGTGIIFANSVTQKVQGSVIDGFEKVTHSKPMLSAAKTKSPAEVEAFVDGKKWYASYKMDGLTLVVRYKGGALQQAITRGNGITGEDVTNNAKMISNIPLKIPFKGELELRGECVISWKQFNAINESLAEPYSHPRNLASGTIRQLDSNIVKERKLSLIIFEVVEGVDRDDKVEKLQFVKDLGFTIVELATDTTVDDAISKLTAENSAYPVDGVIFEYREDKFSKSLGATAHHEQCRIALKWKDNIYETYLRSVEWQVGKTGVITPVAVFDKVDLDGALTTKATLHNLGIVKSLELGIGDKIGVYRSNMVIPNIDENYTRSNTLEIPSNCPCCGGKTYTKEGEGSTFLYCENNNCPAKQLAKFVVFVQRNNANIEGLSEKTLETLMNLGMLNKFADIYHIAEHRDELKEIEGFGEVSVNKMLENIEKSRKIRLANYISAISITGIGGSTAKLISKQFGGDYGKFKEALNSGFNFTVIDGIGEKMNEDIYLWLKNDLLTKDLEKEFQFMVEEEKSELPLAGLRFCITGSFGESRDVLKEKLEAKGAVFVSGVSKNLNVLFAGEKAGSKLSKAEALGIKIMNETELYGLLGE